MGVPGWVYQGGYTGAGRVGIPGEYYPATPFGEPRTTPAERAPEAHRAGVGGCGAGRAYWASWDGGGDGPVPTLRARSVHPVALPGTGPLGLPPPGLYGRELTSFPGNLVKTSKCHQKTSKRPLIVPVSKTGSGIHLLKFSDFHCG